MDIDDDPEVRAARKRWLAGGSALPVVELLASRGAKIEAATYARLALAKPDCPDAAQLKAVLASLSSPPPGWDEALAGFARAPSADSWRDLIRFIPEDSLYLRLLRQSLACENEWCSTYPHMAFIRERASPEQARIFDRAGIPPLE